MILAPKIQSLRGTGNEITPFHHQPRVIPRIYRPQNTKNTYAKQETEREEEERERDTGGEGPGESGDLEVGGGAGSPQQPGGGHGHDRTTRSRRNGLELDYCSSPPRRRTLSVSLSLLWSLSLSLLFSAGSGFGGSFLSFFFFFFGKNISKMQKRLVVQVANWRKNFFGGLLALVGHFPTLFCVCSYTLNILYDLGKSIIQKNGNHFSSHIWFTFRNHRKDLYHLRSINCL